MTRQNKTPRQRAEEALAVANRAVQRLGARKATLREELDAITAEHDQAVVRRDYLREHPDLKQNPTTTSTGDTA